MRKKLVYTLLVLTIVATSLTGCKKKDANIVDNSNETTIETSVSGNDIEENIEKSENNEIQNYLNNYYFECMTREEIATNLQYYKIRDFICNNAITE